MRRRAAADAPVLITEAAPSRDQEFSHRKHRYLLTMVIRAVCIVAAAVSIHILWLALIFAVLGMFLPWMAVLVANDRPPRRAERVNRYAGTGSDHALPAGDRDSRVIDE